MLRTTRVSIFALISVAAVALALPARASDPVDTSLLPRVAGAKETYASPITTMFTAPGSVADAASAATSALKADGWQLYEPPFTSKDETPNVRILSFKKGAQAISVFVTVAPAQGNATSVQYGVIELETDLAFPADAADVLFDPSRPYLSLSTSETVPQMLKFFTSDLAAKGWSQWTPPAGAKGKNTIEDTKATVFFTGAGKQPLLVSLHRKDGEITTKATVEAVAPSLIAELSKPEKVEERAAPAQSEAAKKAADEHNAAFDALTKDIMKQVDGAIADALSGKPASGKPAAKSPATAPTDGGIAPQAQASSDYPVPLPENAEEVEYDGADGDLEFRSPSSVKALAAFYRNALKPAGWKERKSVINRDNMVKLDFAKDGKDLSFTIMQMGDETRVSASGEGLVTTAEVAVASESAEEPAAASPEPTLTAEIKNGLPTPSPHTSTGHEKTLYRISANATVNAKLETVLAFYRSELGKLGWKEEAGARIGKDTASLAYTSTEGPAALALSRKNGETLAILTLRKRAEAEKAGMLPKPGQVKVLFGNVMETEAVITINKKTIKLAALAGSEKPDGPTMELPPGTYKLAFKVQGVAPGEETIEVKADETWGVLMGPGGALPLQMY